MSDSLSLVGDKIDGTAVDGAGLAGKHAAFYARFPCARVTKPVASALWAKS
jgi:hypothetical protein